MDAALTYISCSVDCAILWAPRVEPLADDKQDLPKGFRVTNTVYGTVNLTWVSVAFLRRS
ncbi:hypothetical protein OE88DRAFT_1658502 [Heliocybe sulcata]|uniref:Uncharacterized protein n=1 Tax=Heliocybe sulcata TaxID=5364 RepID=A0A5C3N4C5_9AGAM|nr:hypothetical protein OE88DRAFT_1658502 [Heliocybe sulcata]